MKKILRRKNLNIYGKILLSITLSIFTLTLLLSSVLYLNFEKITLSLINNATRDSLTQVSYSALLMRDSAKSLALQVFTDDNIKKILYSTLESTEIHSGLSRLNDYRDASTLVHSIYLYNRESPFIFTSIVNNERVLYPSFYDATLLDMVQDMKQFKSQSITARKILDPYAFSYTVNPNSIGKQINVFTYLFYDSSEIGGIIDEAVVINISEKWLLNTIKALTTDETIDTLIIDNKGTILLSNTPDMAGKSILNEKYSYQVLNSKDASNYVVAEASGVKSLITYVSSDTLDWKFVSIIPYDTITKKLTKMKILTIIISVVILLMGLISSYVLTKILYKPINYMETKLNRLEYEARKNFQLQKESILKKYLLNNATEMPVDLQQSFTNYNVQINPNKSMFMILLKIDHFADFNKTYNLNDRNLMKFAINNISQELISAEYTCDSVDMSDDHVVIIINFNQKSSEYPPKNLDKLLLEIQSSIYKHLNISVSITVSSLCQFASEVGDLYRECFQASFYRMFFGHQCIIYTYMLEKKDARNYKYPAQKEKQFIDALMLGKLEETKNIFSEIVYDASHLPYLIFQSTLSHLAIAVNASMGSIIQNSGYEIIYDYTDLIVALSQMETLEEIKTSFFAKLEMIITELDYKKQNKHTELISKIDEIIKDKYMDSNFSVNALEEIFNISPIYLGRLYKKVTGKTIADYLLETRLTKAKEFLIHSNCSIVDISDKVGITSSGYFYTLFKKSTGSTPKEFRHANTLQKKEIPNENNDSDL